ISVIESGVPIDKLEGLQRIPRKSAILRLGCSGVISDRKGILELLDGLSLLADLDYNFIWIGGFRDKEFEAKVYEKIKNYGMLEKINITGMVSNTEVFDYLTHLDYFIFPSKYEGLPKSVIEALALGIPSLVSGFVFSNQIEGVEYFENLEKETIAEQIKLFTTSQHVVNRDQIFKQFSWQSRAELIENIYNNLK
ncbi:MAG: glycosyltransferase, partial [Romboutsia sp.]|nr:glycosyltransferase [Romboutsia sp.]